MSTARSFLISELLHAYRNEGLTPTKLVGEALARADHAPDRRIWISRRSREELLQHARTLEERAIDELPLYGIPFVIKDNIDLADVPTTAGCPAYSYAPARSARVVQRLLDAGAIPLGKTNLDQFATGLVGARSPYGACRNSCHPDFISGGSSSINSPPASSAYARPMGRRAIRSIPGWCRADRARARRSRWPRDSRASASARIRRVRAASPPRSTISSA
jgi:hypothetical protein